MTRRRQHPPKQIARQAQPLPSPRRLRKRRARACTRKSLTTTRKSAASAAMPRASRQRAFRTTSSSGPMPRGAPTASARRLKTRKDCKKTKQVKVTWSRHLSRQDFFVGSAALQSRHCTEVFCIVEQIHSSDGFVFCAAICVLGAALSQTRVYTCSMSVSDRS